VLAPSPAVLSAQPQQMAPAGRLLPQVIGPPAAAQGIVAPHDCCWDPQDCKQHLLPLRTAAWWLLLHDPDLTACWTCPHAAAQHDRLLLTHLHWNPQQQTQQRFHLHAALQGSHQQPSMLRAHHRPKGGLLSSAPLLVQKRQQHPLRTQQKPEMQSKGAIVSNVLQWPRQGAT
jgi:hypothetical protein